MHPDAESVDPRSDIRPTDRVLAIGDFGEGKIVVGPAVWGVGTVIEGKAKAVFNARTDRLNVSPLWRGIQQFWLPATGWYEWQEFDGWKKGMKKPKFRMANPSGEPFLLKGVGRFQEGVLRVAFMMQDAPMHLFHVHDRAPLKMTAVLRSIPLEPTH